MKDVLTYSGLSTKIRKMDSNLLSKEQINELCELTSVNEVIEYLNGLDSYKEIFSNVNILSLRRRDLEKLLNISSYRDFLKLYNFSSITQRKYFKIFFLRYEVSVLKQVFREVIDKQKISYSFSEIIPFFNKFSDISLEDLSKVTSVEECITLLENTVYFKPLKYLLNLNDYTIFDIELALDLFYFKYIWKALHKYIKKKDLEIVASTYGSTIDFLNITWIYRCLYFYNMTYEEKKNVLIPISYKLKFSVIDKMLKAENIDEFNKIFSETSYGKKFSPVEINEHNYEKLSKRFLRRLYELNFKNNPYSLACVDTYLYKKNQELKLIVSITESIRYSLPKEEIFNIINY